MSHMLRREFVAAVAPLLFVGLGSRTRKLRRRRLYAHTQLHASTRLARGGLG